MQDAFHAEWTKLRNLTSTFWPDFDHALTSVTSAARQPAR